MKAITINAVIKSGRINKLGETQLYIRVTKERNSQFISTGLMIQPADFDKAKGKCKVIFKNDLAKGLLHQSYNEILHSKIEGIRASVTDESLNFSAKRIKKEVVSKSKNEGLGVLAYFDTRISQLRTEKRIGNTRPYIIAKNKFGKFTGGEISFREVTNELLVEYLNSLKKAGLSYNSIKNYIRTLQALYNFAIKEKNIIPNIDPFKNIGLSTIEKKVTHRALNAMEIETIKAYSPTSKECLALDIWLFSYYNRGINIKDIAHLTKDNVRGGVITYQRKKTHKNYIQQLHPASLPILERQANTSNFLFPILKGVELENENKVYNRVVRVTQNTNNILRAIGEKLNLSLPLTTYVARHSYATQLLRNGTNVALISQALGHSSMVVTQTYLAAFDNSELSKLENLL